MLTLRFDGESDEQFRVRAERTVTIARVLVQACLANQCVQRMLSSAEPLRLDEAGIRRNPIVRVEYEQAYAIGGIGECLHATQKKHWGDGPWIMPLQPDDEFLPMFITYVFRENSVYNRRFHQRMRLKELLGRNHAPLVQFAKERTRALFLRDLRNDQRLAILNRVKVTPEIFWRACQGRTFLDLPKRPTQLLLPFNEG